MKKIIVAVLTPDIMAYGFWANEEIKAGRLIRLKEDNSLFADEDGNELPEHLVYQQYLLQLNNYGQSKE